MYVIDASTKINLKHVVRLEVNERFKRISFHMSNGHNANKDFADIDAVNTELARVEALIDGA